MLRLGLGACLAVGALLPAGASAEEREEGWEGVLTLNLAPRGEAASDMFDLDDLARSGEHGVSLELGSPTILSGQKIVFGAKVSAPDEEDESGVAFTLGVGNGYLNLGPAALIARTGADEEGQEVLDRFRFVAAFSHAEKFAGLFGKGTGNAENLSLELQYIDVRTLWCDEPGRREAATSDGPCSNDPGVSMVWEAKAERTWGTGSEESQDKYAATGRLIGRPIAAAIRAYGEAEAERAVFRDAVDLLGRTRRDWSYAIGAGLDFSGLLVPEPFGLTIGVARNWIDSTDPAEDQSAWSLTATLSWELRR